MEEKTRRASCRRATAGGTGRSNSAARVLLFERSDGDEVRALIRNECQDVHLHQIKCALLVADDTEFDNSTARKCEDCRTGYQKQQCHDRCFKLRIERVIPIFDFWNVGKHK